MSDSAAEPLRLHLLGSFRVVVGGRVVEAGAWRLRKAAAVVKLLALAPGWRLHRDQVIDALWPDHELVAAGHSLNQALYVARRALAPATVPAPYLRSEGELLVLAPPALLWTDVAAFEAASGAARRSRDPAAYRAAIDLYGGDLLPEDRYEAWASEQRDLLRGTQVALLLELARLYEDRGDHAAALAALERVVVVEPACEEAHFGLMRLHATLGRRVQALQQYRRLGEVLRRDLDAEPAPESQRLHQEILAGRFPPPVTRPAVADAEVAEIAVLPARPTLPIQLTDFIGRERELAHVGRLLARGATSRLVTLTGPGGSGKTRLALQVVAALPPAAYPHGIVVVELASLADPALVPTTVATALGLREEPGHSLLATLIAALRSRSLLLILDNCEHMVDACATFADALLRACSSLVIVATSREPLRVAGEVVWPVPPLAVPPLPAEGPGDAPSPAELAGYDAVKLFLARAELVAPSAVPVAADLAAVAAICRRVDGLPLAIELAAARVALLSPVQIAARLDDAFGLLGGGARGALPRHRTLRAAIDWSYDLLEEPEQVLLRRLAVFTGGWTLDAAEAVALGAGLARDDVIESLARLVDKSLVTIERSASAVEPRYHLLETVRQYALERLQAVGEAESLRRRHAAYFLDLAEAAEPRIRSGERAAWLARLAADVDNLRAAFAWARGHDGEFPARLARALVWFWYFSGRAREVREWFALILAQSSAPTRSRAEALYGAGAMAWVLGDYASSRDLLGESVALWRGFASDPPGRLALANALILFGLMLGVGGDAAAAWAAQEEALALFRQSEDRWGLALALYWRGETLRFVRDHAAASASYLESLALFREVDDPWGWALLLQGLGAVAFREGAYATARARLEEALAIRNRVGDRWLAAQSLYTLGTVVRAQGDEERAAACFEESLTIYRAQGDRQGIAVALHYLAESARRRGEPRWLVLYRESLVLARDLGHRRRMAEALEAIAAGVAGGDPAQAARFRAAAVALRQATAPLSPDTEVAIIEATVGIQG